MKKAIQFGAGNIGRGFIADILHDSGYEVTFIDVDEKIIAQINQNHKFDLYLIDHDYQMKVIDHVNALSSITQLDDVVNAIVEADVITTSVWANNLPKIAPALAKGLKARLEAGKKRVNVLACENAMFGTDILKKAMVDCAVEISEQELDQIAGFPNTAVDRVVIAGEKDGKAIVNIADYHELAVEETKLVDINDKPINSARYTDNLQKYLERKLYVINCGHAWAGYVGYVNAYTSVYDVFMTPSLVADVKEAMLESAKLISEKYDFSEQEMNEYVEFGIKRYQAKGVDYDVSMVTRSPIRKLGSTDRFVGPCVQCEEKGLPNEYLLKGIAMVLLLDRSDDAEAVELQDYIGKNSVAQAVEHYTGIKSESKMHKAIMGYYQEFKAIRDTKRK